MSDFEGLQDDLCVLMDLMPLEEKLEVLRGLTTVHVSTLQKSDIMEDVEDMMQQYGYRFRGMEADSYFDFDNYEGSWIPEVQFGETPCVEITDKHCLLCSRLALNMSVREAADVAGISYGYLGKIERGDSYNDYHLVNAYRPMIQKDIEFYEGIVK